MFPSQRENLSHAALGLITEIGEFASEVKRIAIYGKPLSEEMRQHMIEELGDASWYVPLALHAEGVEHFDYKPSVQALALVHTKLDTIAHALNEMSGAVSGAVLHGRGCCHLHLLSIVALIDIAAHLLHTDGGQVRAQNILKLRKRFPDAYSDEAAEARADKDGADHRNS
jgi:NTP pyrophosphatase (non-canonical NTP hydrolase)